MVSLVFAAVLATQGSDTHIVLSRGGVAHGVPVWDVEDATLDAAKPTVNSEGDMDLAGGPFRTILIRFGDLDRVIGPHQRVTHASLVLTTSGGDKPKLQSVSRVLVPWGAGPYRTLAGFALPHAPAAGDDKTDIVSAAPRGSATWRDRCTGERGGTWEQPGARGSQDTVPISNPAFESTAAEAHIGGLEGAVQEMADHPDENHGFAVILDNNASFSSSESDAGRPRLELEVEDQPERKGPDLSVVAIERTGPDGKLPNEGQEATFTAHVKNVGDAPAKGFAATWIVDDRPGTTSANDKALAPGEATTLTYHLTYRPDKTDHRFQTIGLRIRPGGDDANPRNDALTVPIAAKPVQVVVTFDAAKAIQAGENALGSHAVEDWVQAQVRTFNDVYLAQSRFSFAPEGAKERIAVQRVLVGDPAIPQTQDGSLAAAVTNVPADLRAIDREFLRQLGEVIGLADRAASNVAPARNELLPCGGLDRYPGLMEYGDTRFEGLAPGQIELPYEAYPAPVFDVPPLEPTGLLAATDVLRLNAALGGPAANLPKTILVRAKTQNDLPLANLKMDFFAATDGKVAKDAAPAFSATSDANGLVLLPTKGATAFGPADPPPGADAYFVRASLNGVTTGSWLKAWQAIDTAARGGPGTSASAIMDLHFNLPAAELDPLTNLAADRIVTDSAGSLPAKLAALIDGSNDTEATVGGKAGDWLEMDLGRDRTIGEIDLIGEPGAFWRKFDVFVYATGQHADEATVWAKEVDWGWTSANRAAVVTPNRVSVAYRGPAIRVRYIRFVERSDQPGRIAEIRVVPVKNP